MTTMTRALADCSFASWDETTYDETEGRPKMTRVRVVNRYAGDIEGEGTLDYLMAYGSAVVSYCGYERIVGRVGVREGSFVLEHHGRYEDGVAKTTWVVAPGTGTGQLTGLRGEGGFLGKHEQPTPVYLDYEL
jgi:hypothetical protein